VLTAAGEIQDEVPNNMGRGRRTDGAKLVDRLNGSAEAKARLKMILETLSAERTAGQAGLAVGIGERRLHKLRLRALQHALSSLEFQPVGRRARQPSQDDRHIEVLEAEVQRLRIDLRAAQIREEIALSIPQLLKKKRHAKKRLHPKMRRHNGVGKPGT
jgi:hypothetical protein